MKIVFSSAHINAPSFCFYANSLRKVNESFQDVSLEILENPKHVNYVEYDVSLFMGYDPETHLAKEQNPNIITGILDPRGAKNTDFSKVDFIVANGLESKDFFARYKKDVIIYYTYPEVMPKMDCPIKKECLVLGYHGNRVHLEQMVPRITDAISRLSEKIPLELWAMYNIANLGEWIPSKKCKQNFVIRHIQYSEENYAQYIANVDIGIVPQFMRFYSYDFKDIFSRLFTIRNSDNCYYFKFKETTNIGRHLVFAQYGVPVISDMSPSSCSLIEDGCNGYVAFHTDGWYHALEKLAGSQVTRENMGEKLKKRFQEVYQHNIQNMILIDYLRKRMGNKVELS